MNSMNDMKAVDWAVEGVPRQHLHHVWGKAWPYLQLAVNRFPQVQNKLTDDIVFDRLCSGSMQLWIGWSYADDDVCGAVLTEIITDEKHPGMVFMSIPLVGGDHWMAWGDTLWNTLKAWGSANGCSHALGYGRKGWMRLYGFDPAGKTEDGIPRFIRKLKAH